MGRKKIDLNNASLTEETTTENKDLKKSSIIQQYSMKQLQEKEK
jgi:hypothetical protein